MNEPQPMDDQPIDDVHMPVEIDFSKGIRGLHHIPPGAKVLIPASIEPGPNGNVEIDEALKLPVRG